MAKKEDPSPNKKGGFQQNFYGKVNIGKQENIAGDKIDHHHSLKESIEEPTPQPIAHPQTSVAAPKSWHSSKSVKLLTVGVLAFVVVYLFLIYVVGCGWRISLTGALVGGMAAAYFIRSMDPNLIYKYFAWGFFFSFTGSLGLLGLDIEAQTSGTWWSGLLKSPSDLITGLFMILSFLGFCFSGWMHYLLNQPAEV